MSKKMILVHVGYPKTATTWFQKKFYPGIENFRYVSREDIIENILDANAFDFHPLKIRKYFFDKYGERIILCEERIIADLRNRGVLLKENAKRIKAIFPEAQIIIFIRNQVEIMASKYSQYIKAGGTYSIKKYLFRPKNSDFRIEEIFTPFLYDKVIRYYYSIFGEENVTVYLYEEFAQRPLSVIKNMMNLYGLESAVLPDFTPVNLRLRLIIYFLMRFFNVFTKKRRIYKYYLIHIPYLFEASRVILLFFNKSVIFGKPVSTQWILKKKNIRYIKNYYRDSNNELRNNLGFVSLEEYDYPL